MGKRFLCLAIVFAIAITAPFTVFCKEINTLSGIKSAVEGVISYKCEQENAGSFSELLDKLSGNAGTYSADWYYIAFAQYGLNCNNQKSIDALKSKVDEFYSGDLANVKATDMQRVALALSSCDVDITEVNGHNLLADATYNRAAVKSLSSQGINSVAYALILLDYQNYSVPDNALTTRENMIELILKAELKNGGFSLFGSNPDVDMTSIAVQALAPYKDRADVKLTLNKCINILSAGQDKTGGYKSFSNEISCESTAQVVLCLSAMGINPAEDSRFIKNGNSVLDGLMVFKLKNGSFSHFKNGDSDNMATYQALCALVGSYRVLNGQEPFYSISNNTKKTVVDVKKHKSKTKTTSKTENTNNKTENKEKSESVSDSSSVTDSTQSKDESSTTYSTEKPTDKVEFVTKPETSEDAIQESTSVPETGISTNVPYYNSKKENKTRKNNVNKQTPLYINCGVLTLAYLALVFIKRRKK